MKPAELLSKAKDTVTVRQVYGEPYEKDGVTIITAAAVMGAGGGGEGTREGEEGEGGGFGLAARPTGVFVLSEGRLRWHPAVDVNRLLPAVVAALVVLAVTWGRVRRATLKARS
jgi:uncharacterized spore protein YtfJ